MGVSKKWERADKNKLLPDESPTHTTPGTRRREGLPEDTTNTQVRPVGCYRWGPSQRVLALSLCAVIYDYRVLAQVGRVLIQITRRDYSTLPCRAACLSSPMRCEGGTGGER